MKNILLSTVLISTLGLTACAPTSKSYQMYKSSVDEQHQKNLAFLNQQSGDLKDIDQDAAYAKTEDQKFYFNLVNTYVKDPVALRGEKMDPASNPEAEAIAEKKFQIAKKEILKNGKLNNRPRTESIKTIKMMENRKGNVFYLLASKPANASVAAIDPIDMAYFEPYDQVYIHYDVSSPEKAAEMFTRLSNAFSFLDTDKRWVKSVDFLSKSNENTLAQWKKLLAAHQQAYKENEAANHSSPYYKVRKDELTKDISEVKAYIAEMEERVKRTKADTPKQVIYAYRWKGKTKYGLNQYVVSINNKEDYVGVNISKMIGK